MCVFSDQAQQASMSEVKRNFVRIKYQSKASKDDRISIAMVHYTVRLNSAGLTTEMERRPAHQKYLSMILLTANRPSSASHDCQLDSVKACTETVVLVLYELYCTTSKYY